MKKIFFYLIILVIFTNCKEPFTVPVSSPSSGYLVVEGFINSGESPTTITLSRTTKLYDSVINIYENFARVTIESESNASFPLNENTDGVYVSSQLNLNSSEKYRLHILTSDGKEYASSFSPVKSTPDIDSVSWLRENGGVQLYINTHDAQNNTKYYQWKYEETWEFHSPIPNNLKYRYNAAGDIIGVEYKNLFGTVDTSILYCWKTVNSSSITLGSSEKLSQDLIYLPFIYIGPAAEKLSVLYSVNLRQYAVSKEAYLFYQKMKKNTEQLGSIFDAQPSDIKGNIQSISNPAEIVVGFVEVTQEKEKRVFINNSQLPNWGYRVACYQQEFQNDEKWLRENGTQGLMPAYALAPDPFGGIKTFLASENKCIDCTLRGTNVKPLFWP